LMMTFSTMMSNDDDVGGGVGTCKSFIFKSFI